MIYLQIKSINMFVLYLKIGFLIRPFPSDKNLRHWIIRGLTKKLRYNNASPKCVCVRGGEAIEIGDT